MTPGLGLLLLCASFEDDLWITVCWQRETRREKRASGLMAHGKMDRSKQEREISDVTYGPHTQSIREGPKWCLCQSDGCMPLLLWKEWDATLHPGLVSPLLSTSAIKARHSSCLANKSLKSSWLLLVGADSFHAEAGFTCPHLGGYQLLLPNCVRNLHSSKPLVREMLPSTCSKHQGCCWLLYPVRHQGWAPAVAWSGRWWAKGNAKHFK